MASATCASIVRSWSSVATEPVTPAATRSVLWPTNHARLADVPIWRMTSQVLAERGPGDRAVVAKQRQPIGKVGAGQFAERCEALTAVANDLGRHTLADGAFTGWVGEQRPIRMAVRIDEPRANDLAVASITRWADAPSRRLTSTTRSPSIATSAG